MMLDKEQDKHRVELESAHERHELLVTTVLIVLAGVATSATGWWLTLDAPYSPRWLSQPVWLSILARVLFAASGGACAIGAIAGWYVRHRELLRTVEAAQQEAFFARSPIREGIRWWASHLENEFAWLLESSPEQRREWAVRRFREVITEWPAEHRLFESLRQREEFDQALAEVGTPAHRMIDIWNIRSSLYQWARSEVTAIDRVIGGLDAQEEIARAKVERIQTFEAFRDRRDQDTSGVSSKAEDI